ncbi:hypothetical protein LSTR_LSTR007938 [Laodelphax striatellus]|uniref:Uncharacterized protein n=1 Tax=Laodelphax striatellus TaxID=195883 RepID=A0A482XR00_LAOST|nr:hypothetical protein LSTR_LSTR007938 [Laodelphax striatellus]
MFFSTLFVHEKEEDDEEEEREKDRYKIVERDLDGRLDASESFSDAGWRNVGRLLIALAASRRPSPPTKTITLQRAGIAGSIAGGEYLRSTEVDADEEIVAMKPLEVKGGGLDDGGAAEGAEPPDPRLNELLSRLDTAVIYPEEPPTRTSDNVTYRIDMRENWGDQEGTREFAVSAIVLLKKNWILKFVTKNMELIWD